MALESSTNNELDIFLMRNAMHMNFEHIAARRYSKRFYCA